MLRLPRNFRRADIETCFDDQGYYVRPWKPESGPEWDPEIAPSGVNRVRQSVYQHVFKVLDLAPGKIGFTQYVELKGPEEKSAETVKVVLAELEELGWLADLQIKNKGKDFYLVLHEGYRRG